VIISGDAVKNELYIENGWVTTENGLFEGSVLVWDGIIISLSREIFPSTDHQVIDLQSRILMPSLVDGHVHLNEPGHSYLEGYANQEKM
jgi:dihydroorotase-like cyclic amidohydrolase